MAFQTAQDCFMEEVFKKNEKYSQNEITKLIDVYKMALAADDSDTVQEVLNRIYLFSEKYVYKTLWDNYKTIMQNPWHREDLKQEVWARIFKELRNYDPDKGALTTFILPWIKHVVSEYTSKNFRNTSVYYASAMQKINGAQNYCKSYGLNSNDMDVLMRLTGLSDTTIKNALNLMAKKDTTSYEVLIDTGGDRTSGIKGPEEAMLEADSDDGLNEILRETLTDREMMLIQILLNPEKDGKKHSSYREMMEKIPGSNIPQLKRDVSHAFTKIITSKKFKLRYPYIAIQEKILEENYIPVLDSDDRYEVDAMYDSFLEDIGKPDPQVRKCSTEACPAEAAACSAD